MKHLAYVLITFYSVFHLIGMIVLKLHLYGEKKIRCS